MKDSSSQTTSPVVIAVGEDKLKAASPHKQHINSTINDSILLPIPTQDDDADEDASDDGHAACFGPGIYLSSFNKKSTTSDPVVVELQREIAIHGKNPTGGGSSSSSGSSRSNHLSIPPAGISLQGDSLDDDTDNDDYTISSYSTHALIDTDTGLYNGEGFTKVSINQPSGDTPLGISFAKQRPDSWRIVVTRIHSDGALARDFNNKESHKRLHPGQTILGINGRLTKDMESPKELTRFLKALSPPARICIIATNSIVATVFKPTRESKVGIAFCQRDDKNSSVGRYDDDHDRETDAVVTTHRSDERIWIYRLTENGLLDKTGLLHAGMKVIAINNRACP